MEGTQLFSPRYSDVPIGYYSSTTEIQLGRTMTPNPNPDNLSYFSRSYLSDSNGNTAPINRSNFSPNHVSNGTSSNRINYQSTPQANYTVPLNQSMNPYTSRSETNFQLKTSAFPSPAPSLRSVISESAGPLPPEQTRLSALHRQSLSSQKPRSNERALNPSITGIPMSRNLKSDAGPPKSPLPYSGRTTTSDNESTPFRSSTINGTYPQHSPQLTGSESPNRVGPYAPRPLPKLPLQVSTPTPLSNSPTSGTSTATSSPSTPLTIQHMLSKRYQQSPVAASAGPSPIQSQYGPLRTCTAEGILNSFAGVRSPQPSTSSPTPSGSSPYAIAQRSAASASSSAFSFTPNVNVNANAVNVLSSNHSAFSVFASEEAASRPASGTRGSGVELLSAESSAAAVAIAASASASASAAVSSSRCALPPPLPPHNSRSLTPRAVESGALALAPAPEFDPSASASKSRTAIGSTQPLASTSTSTAAPVVVAAAISGPTCICGSVSGSGSGSGGSGQSSSTSMSMSMSMEREREEATALAARVRELERENAELRCTMDANEVAMMRMFDARKRQWIAVCTTVPPALPLPLPLPHYCCTRTRTTSIWPLRT